MRAAGDMTAYVYMLRCSDGRYYVGSTRGELEKRVAEHNAGTFGGFTKRRRPVTLVYHQSFERIDDAIAAERQLKGWGRAKKEALIAGDFEALKRLAKRGPSSFETRAAPAPQDEGKPSL
jgi:predicted GIY-YIG superfamily endonuclease